MDSDGWLSTKNKKKIQKPPQRLKKIRSSALKQSKPSPLHLTHSPPPKELFTSTKQSSLKDFFSSNEESQLEVEVIFEPDAQSQRQTEQDEHSHCPISLTTEACANKYASVKGEDTRSFVNNSEDKSKTDGAVRAQDQEISGKNMSNTNAAEGNVRINFSCNQTDKGDTFVKDVHEDIDTSDNVYLENKDKNARISSKRIRCADDRNVDIESPLKRARLDVLMVESDSEFTERNDKVDMIDFDKSDRRNYQTDIDKGVESISDIKQPFDVEASLENDSDVVENDIQYSRFTSQSLDLGSQYSLNLNSQDAGIELSSLTTTQFDPKIDLENTLQKTDSQGNCLSVSYLTKHIDRLTKNGEDNVNSIDGDAFTLTDSQTNTLVEKVRISNNVLKCVNDNNINTETFTLSESQTNTYVNQTQTKRSNIVFQGVDVETLSMEPYTLSDSQNEMLDDSFGNITSSPSLDLSSENHSYDRSTGTKSTLNLPESSSDYSQLNLSLSLPASNSEYQSLDLS